MAGTTLNDRSLVEIGGPDAQSLLQGIITADIASLDTGEAKAGALLTPQGKILFDFVISREGADGFLLEVFRTAAADFVKRLALYRLRAKVEIRQDDSRPVRVFWNEAPEGGIRDTRFRVGTAVYRSYDAGPEPQGTPAEYALLRIASGVAESVSDFPAGDAFPHDVLFDLNGGVSFRKGCFVGQEVVSRMQHRGTARKRIVIADADEPLESGATIEADGRPIGTLGTTAETRALALVRTDKAADAIEAGQPITAGGRVLRLSFPEWTGLSFERPAAEADSA
jgi:folate-binding protein YgfZ